MFISFVHSFRHTVFYKSDKNILLEICFKQLSKVLFQSIVFKVELSLF